MSDHGEDMASQVARESPGAPPNEEAGIKGGERSEEHPEGAQDEFCTGGEDMASQMARRTADEQRGIHEPHHG